LSNLYRANFGKVSGCLFDKVCLKADYGEGDSSIS